GGLRASSAPRPRDAHGISLGGPSGGGRPGRAPPIARVGADPMDPGARVLLRLSHIPRLRHRAPDHDPLRGLARPRARLRRHRHPRPGRLLRRRRLHGRHPGQARYLERADHGPGPRGGGGGGDRARVGARALAHRRADPAHADPVHDGAARGGRQPGARLHRRLRRPRQPADCAAARPVRVQSALSDDAVSLRPRRALRLLRVRADARLLAVRPEPDRHSREHPAHARGRRARARPPRPLLRALRGDRRRPLGSGQRLRESRHARSRPRGHGADHPRAGGLRSPLRRVRRRHRVHGALAFPVEGVSDRLAARSRAHARRHRALRPQRYPGNRRARGPLASTAAPDAMTAPLLETRALCRNFGALTAARDIDFRLEAGARHALIGPNGAGKTTVINLLTGVTAPTSGAILLRGRDITKVDQAQRVKLGIARTFQINRLFRRLTVLENVYLAVAERVGAAPSMFQPAGTRKEVIEESMGLLDTLKVAPHASRRVWELPYGRQRLVELAIALGLKPEVLLLDEPAAGVPSAESHIILDAIDGLPRQIGVLIIDHDMDLVFRFAERITVLVGGAVFATGSPREIGAGPNVRAVYLGQAARG